VREDVGAVSALDQLSDFCHDSYLSLCDVAHVSGAVLFVASFIAAQKIV